MSEKTIESRYIQPRFTSLSAREFVVLYDCSRCRASHESPKKKIREDPDYQNYCFGVPHLAIQGEGSCGDGGNNIGGALGHVPPQQAHLEHQ